MSSINRSSKRRRRKPPVSYHSTQVSSVEERFLQQAIQNSKLDTQRPIDGKLTVPDGPTFFPTVEEFEGNPLHYIEKVRPIAEKYGICKIVPPQGWNPPFCVDMESDKKFQTKEQLLWRLQEGISFGDGEDYTAAEYQKYASQMAYEWRSKHYPEHEKVFDSVIRNGGSPGKTNENAVPVHDEEGNITTVSHVAENKCMTPENLERDYWDIVETDNREIVVEYGNDVETDKFGSGFPMSERGRAINGTVDVDKASLPEPKFGSDDYYKETWWNLNNIPCAPDSVLRHVRVGINGINVPWMYYGCLFSTFCWHNEDNYLYSINYHHRGAPKRWYGVPGTKKDADGLEKVFKSYLSMKMRETPDLMHHITTMFSPRLLQNAGVPVYKLLQYEGEFVVTFPRAFHGGFSLGPNVGEAVNFAPHDWIAYGADANERYRSYARPAVFSHDRLGFTMATHLSEQKTYGTCILLQKELERIIDEELRLRGKLLDDGVRDVSGIITLPRNRCDQLDAESADYDDKRLCFACKHICFFSAVACECSQTKVSCLRHSHYMCRCPSERKYLMVWCGEDEMKKTLKTVQDFCSPLKTKTDIVSVDDNSPGVVTSIDDKMPPVAPGVERDLENHKYDAIDIDPIVGGDLSPSFVPQSPVRTVTADSTPIKSEELHGRQVSDSNFSSDDNDDIICLGSQKIQGSIAVPKAIKFDQ